MQITDTAIKFDGYYFYKETDKSGFAIVFSEKGKYNFGGIGIEGGKPYRTSLLILACGIQDGARNSKMINIIDKYTIGVCDGTFQISENGEEVTYRDKKFYFFHDDSIFKEKL